MGPRLCGFYIPARPREASCVALAAGVTLVSARDADRIAGLDGFVRAVDKPVGERGRTRSPPDCRDCGPTTGFNATLSSASSAATLMPCAPKTSAVAGRRSVFGSEGMWKWTSAKAPGQSFPSGIVRLQLDQRGARILRHRVRGRDELRLEGLLLTRQMRASP